MNKQVILIIRQSFLPSQMKVHRADGDSAYTLMCICSQCIQGHNCEISSWNCLLNLCYTLELGQLLFIIFQLIFFYIPNCP